MSEKERPEQESAVVNESTIKNGKRKAFIIGISKYDHSNKFRDLDFCENDANEVYNILKDQGYDIPQDRLLIGRVEWSKMRDEIIGFFTDRRLRSDDTLFFYFSGHGYLDKNTGRTYLATSEIDPEWPERRAFRFDDLTTYLNDSRSERIVAVLDCCYSGALEIGGKGAEDGGEEEETAKAESEKGEEIASLAEVNMRKTTERLIKSGQGKCVLASSLEEQKSFKMEGQPYSTFTYFLIEGLRGADGESVDSNGYVTPELLGSYVNKKMEEIPKVKQKPIRKIEVTGLLNLAHHPSLAKRQQHSRRDYLLQLLREGKIAEFNEIRKKDNHSRLDLYQADLVGTDLSHADLRNADLNFADLRGAKLQGARIIQASLYRASLSNANLSRVELSKSNLSDANLVRANLSYSDLSNANLSGVELSKSNLSDANLVRANLSEADLFGANLSKAIVSKTNLSDANLSDAELSKANLSGAQLINANLSNANLSEADLFGANLSEADLSYAELSNANLSEADLFGANLSEADLFGANLSKANLSDANLSYAELSKVNLSGAQLINANLSNAELFGANLSKANLSDANLSDAYLASSIIIGVNFSENKKHYPSCANTNFSNAIVDDKHLSKYLRESNSSGVPQAVKDKKELREKLRERGFDGETIDQYLSYSSLPDST